jgi:hypothetical protein
MDLLRGAIAEFSQRHAGAVGASGDHSLDSHVSSAAATQA